MKIDFWSNQIFWNAHPKTLNGEANTISVKPGKCREKKVYSFCLQELCKQKQNSISGQNMKNWQANTSVMEKISPNCLIAGSISGFLQHLSNIVLWKKNAIYCKIVTNLKNFVSCGLQLYVQQGFWETCSACWAKIEQPIFLRHIKIQWSVNCKTIFIFHLDLEDSGGITHCFLGTIMKTLEFVQPCTWSVHTVLLWNDLAIPMTIGISSAPDSLTVLLRLDGMELGYF